jgi:hypothetical protein
MVRTHLLNSAAQRGVTELLVHVVGTRARVVSHSDAEVLHDAVIALTNLELTQAYGKEAYLGQNSGGSPHHHKTRTSFTEITSPVARFILLYWCKKYQKRDLATTSLGAKMRMR